MNYRWLAFWAVALLLVLNGCTLQAAPPVQTDRETAVAIAPQPTPTAQPTATSLPTPSAAPTATLEPTAESVTTTAEPAPSPQALVDTSYCRRSFGPANASRFRARLDHIRTDQTDDFEQVALVFADTDGNLGGDAACAPIGVWPRTVAYGSSDLAGVAMITLDLPNWAHDDLFAASTLTETNTISSSAVVQDVAFAADPLASRGAVVGIGLDQPRPFRVRVQNNEIVVEIAREAPFPPQDDPLGQAAGDEVELDDPVFFLHQNDVYRLQDGQAQPVIETPEQEIGLAISPDGSLIAVCRAPADAEPFALPYDVRATLWTMRSDGSDQHQLADVGGCAEPAFAASGRTIAFTGNVAPSPPAVLQVWTVPVVGGDATPAVGGLDEWSRFQPRWLDDGRLVYRARNDGDQQVLFVRNEDGTEREVSAQVLTGPEYRGVGQFALDPQRGEIAVEALRSADDGADLVVLRDDGTIVATEKRGFWQRPLGYAADGLIYLSADCPAEAALSYTLQRRTSQGAIEALVRGTTAAAIGAASVQNDAIVYVRSADAPVGVRGPAVTPDLNSASSVWALSADGTARTELFSADAAISAVKAANQ